LHYLQIKKDKYIKEIKSFHIFYKMLLNVIIVGTFVILLIILIMNFKIKMLELYHQWVIEDLKDELKIKDCKIDKMKKIINENIHIINETIGVIDWLNIIIDNNQIRIGRLYDDIEHLRRSKKIQIEILERKILELQAEVHD